MLERGARDVQVAFADVVHGFVVDQEGAVGMLDGGVRGEHGVVGLYDRGGHSRGRVHGKFKLAFFAVVCCEALEEEGAKP